MSKDAAAKLAKARAAYANAQLFNRDARAIRDRVYDAVNAAEAAFESADDDVNFTQTLEEEAAHAVTVAEKLLNEAAVPVDGLSDLVTGAVDATAKAAEATRAVLAAVTDRDGFAPTPVCQAACKAKDAAKALAAILETTAGFYRGATRSQAMNTLFTKLYGPQR